MHCSRVVTPTEHFNTMSLNLCIGHAPNLTKNSGITVFLPTKRATCSWWLCGSAPASRDVNLLDPAATVDKIDALVFTGGSAYGLDASAGVMRWLQERNRGHKTSHTVVPIVPTAGIYDLGISQLTFPSPDDAYQACENAVENSTLHGRVGAGIGASIGKLLENARHMTGGYGYAQIDTADGLSVLACVVVNAVGDVLDAQGHIVAGAVNENGDFANITKQLIAGQRGKTALENHNTTLAAIFTNAALDKNQLTRVAKMASAGMARAISPVFTSYDGDMVFSVSVGTIKADEIVVGSMAASALHQAILNAVQNAKVI